MHSEYIQFITSTLEGEYGARKSAVAAAFNHTLTAMNPDGWVRLCPIFEGGKEKH